MLSREELREIARARVNDAKVLLAGQRWDGAVYLCGYAVEIGLKSRIVATCGLHGFPETDAEFKALKPLWLKVHKLDNLLTLSGREPRVKSRYLTEWSGVAQWEPEARYKRIGSAKKQDAERMIHCTERLLRVLYAR